MILKCRVKDVIAWHYEQYCRVSDVMSFGGYNCKASWGQLRIKQLNQTNTICALLNGGERIKEKERGGGRNCCSST